MFSWSWCSKKKKSYTEKLRGLHNDLLFLPEKLKIGKVEKFLCWIEYVVEIKDLKQTLNHGPVLKKVHRVIKFKNLVNI